MAKKQLSEEEVKKQQEEAKVKLVMDSMLEQIKAYQSEIDNINNLTKLKIDEIKDKSNQKTAGYQAMIDMIKVDLMNLYDKVSKTETKSQYKVTLISGDVVVKKAAPTYDYDKNKLLEYANNKVNDFLTKQNEIGNRIEELESLLSNLLSDNEILRIQTEIDELREQLNQECEWFDYVKNKTTYDFDWAAFKAKLEITEKEDENHNKTYEIVDKDTGEVLNNIDGLSVIIEPEKVVIQ